MAFALIYNTQIDTPIREYLALLLGYAVVDDNHVDFFETGKISDADFGTIHFHI